MSLKITVVTENSVTKRNFLAEHGLSLFIEAGDFKLLFDTGQGLALESNIKNLHIDLQEINAIALSHGHNDHTGGLKQVLSLSGAKAVYGHPGIFDEKYSVNGEGQHSPNGLPFRRDELEQLGAEFHLQREPVLLNKGIILCGQVPRVTDFEELNPHFAVKKEGQYEIDPLWDDQALLIDTPKGLVVVVGCSHSGLINILRYALQVTDNQQIYAVVGGTHLVAANDEKLHKTIEELKKLKVEKLAVSHCTGFHAQLKLKEAFGHGFILNNVGHTFIVE